MAKNCSTCSLPISSEQSFVCCVSCRSNAVHLTCVNTHEQAQFCDASKRWKCSACDTYGSEENLSSCDNCRECVGKLDELLSKIKVLQEDQNGIVTSIINTCNDTIGEYEESINGLTSLLSSFRLQLDEFNSNDQNDDINEEKFTRTEGGSSSTKL